MPIGSRTYPSSSRRRWRSCARRSAIASTKGEVIAILESREVADAKSEYLAARLTNELQQDLYERDKELWDKRSSTEQQLLRSRNLAAQARMSFDIARQKLFAFGLTDSEIAALPNEPEALLRRQEVRAPMAGRVVGAQGRSRHGGRTRQSRDRTFRDRRSRSGLGRTRRQPGRPAHGQGGADRDDRARGVADRADGKIVFISPMLDKELAFGARRGRDRQHRRHLAARLVRDRRRSRVEEQPSRSSFPRSAIQTIGGDKVVFVRTPEGFEKRAVVARAQRRSHQRKSCRVCNPARSSR